MPVQLIFMVNESPEGGFEAHALGESIFTEADDMENLYTHVRDSIHCHFEETDTPKVIRLHFVREGILAG